MNTFPPGKLSLDSQGLHLMGDFDGRSSLCQSGRDLRDAVYHLNCPVEILNLRLSTERASASGRISDFRNEDFRVPKSSLSILNWNGDGYERIARELPASLFQNRRIAGIWYWETEQGLPDAHRRGYDLVDEVWVTSRFIAESLARTSPVPVRHFPYLLRELEVPQQLVLPDILDNDRFVYLFSFHYGSVGKRKNPEALCESFVKAFPDQLPNGPLCVVKSVAGQTHHRLQYLELMCRYHHRQDIIFLDGWVTLEERNSLMARANCYVSLHRSEGLGLTLMESMSLGKPCIATNYSGNLDFMTQENSWLIPYEMVDIGPGYWPYPPKHQWAEVNVEAAAAAMREVHDNPGLAGAKGELGRRTILENHNVDAVSTRLRVLMEQCLELPVRVKPMAQRPPASPERPAEEKPPEWQQLSGRARAYQLLKQSQSMEKDARKQSKALDFRKLPKDAVSYLKSLQEIIKIQHQVQSETLRDLGDLKNRLASYHPGTFDDLIRDRNLATDMLAGIYKVLRKDGPTSTQS